MGEGLPPKLSILFAASGPVERERAWCAFLEEYSRVLLHAAHSTAANYDEAMDRYAYILDRLREDDLRRLRAFVADRRGKFTTWLVVVARRLCIDYHRHQYGRVGPTGADDQSVRRRLVDFVAGSLDPNVVPDTTALDPDSELLAQERRHALEQALSVLEPRDQLLITLRFNDEMPVWRIARMMGFSSRFHVYRRLKALLQMLRDSLEQRGISEP